MKRPETVSHCYIAVMAIFKISLECPENGKRESVKVDASNREDALKAAVSKAKGSCPEWTINRVTGG